MTSGAKKIFEQALALPQDERAALIDALADSLEVAEDDLTPQWSVEIGRRIEAVERGESHVIPWDEVEVRIRAKLERL